MRARHPAEVSPTIAGMRSRLPAVFADVITGSRLLMALLLPALGHFGGEERLPAAMAVYVIGWTGDSVDGWLSRRSGGQPETFFGRGDLAVDVAFSAGILAYLAFAGLVPTAAALAYGAGAVAWLLFAPVRTTAVLVQAPVVILAPALALLHRPVLGTAVLVWAAALLALTHRRLRRRLGLLR